MISKKQRALWMVATSLREQRALWRYAMIEQNDEIVLVSGDPVSSVGSDGSDEML